MTAPKRYYKSMFFRTFITWLFTMPLFIVLFPFMLLSGILTGRGDTIHRLGIIWMKAVLFFSGVKVTVTGTENIPTDRPVIFAANHSGTYDIPVLHAKLPGHFRWISKRSLFSIPFVGWGMTMAGYIPIDLDGDARTALRSLTKAAKKIKDGTSVLLFPEGTRNTTDKLLEFKGGAFILAVKSGAPIVPIAVSGTRDIMKIGGYTVTPHDVTITIGKPIESEGIKSNQLADKTKEAIEGLLSKEG